MVDFLIEVNIKKVVIKILKGSVDTQTMLSVLTIHPPFLISYSVCVPKL